MKVLNTEQIKYILSLKQEDMSKELITDLFTVSDFSSEPKFSPLDSFTLKAGSYFNDTDIKTTIGRYLVNLFVFPKRFLAKVKYINEPLTKKKFGALENEMGIMIFNGEMPEKEYIEYMDNAIWLFMGQSYLLNPSMDSAIAVPIPEVIELRDKLFEQHKDKLEAEDTATIDKVEKILLDKAKEILEKQNPQSYDYYNAGVADFANAYRKTAIMIGAVKNPATNKIRVIKSNYTDGLKKDEYSFTSHLTASGGYARAEGTKLSGYSTKKYLNTTSGITLDEPGSDCGAEQTLTVKIEDYNMGAFTNRYIVENGKLVFLDYKKIKEYVNQTVQMRSPMFCTSSNICSKCAGEHYYMMGIKNAGIHINAMGGRLLNLGMKKFHDASIKYQTIDITKFIT